MTLLVSTEHSREVLDGGKTIDEQGLREFTAQNVALAEGGFCRISIRSRGCPGKNMAWLEMSLIVVNIMGIRV
ncbi:benzoate 4-monooxygenase cytochrome-like protein P450 [Apiospora saccharicola]|uniref:Benzoate 4-monooxygenase cytochrome-like protein P450 n=1 Tax=Apiospora saccharicola TaxID=335842 RepID=A0ABR1WF12_9PEZI